MGICPSYANLDIGTVKKTGHQGLKKKRRRRRRNLGGSAGKESSCNAGDLGSIPGFEDWVGKIPWRREQLPTLVFWPGEFHGLFSPWGCKESGLSNFDFHFSLYLENQFHA